MSRLLLTMLCFLVPAIRTQDLGHKAAAQSAPVLIEGATIHPISRAPIQDGWILFAEGKIQGLGHGKPEKPLAGGTIRIEAKGKHVYPGMIGAVTQIGLSEIGSVRATQDARELGDFTPEVRAAVAVNPDSTVIPVTRSNGVLVAGVFPKGGRIPGRASVIALSGWTAEDMTLRAEAGLVVRWPTKRRSFRFGFGGHRPQSAVTPDVAAQRQAVKDRFEEARAYLEARKADANVPTDIRLEAMASALDGSVPVFFSANEVEQIESAVAFAVTEKLKPVIVGGRDARLCLDLLKRHHVAVIVTGTHKLPRRRDSGYDAAYTLPAALQAAGVHWCLASGGSFYNERNLPYHAATAVAHGLQHDAALRAITLSAAEILGVANRLGSLDKGKSATLIVTDGDPLEIATHVEIAFVTGKRIDLRNKQTELARKYREKYRQLGLIGK